MKTTHAVASIFALFGLSAATPAQAATGAYDGSYDLHYGLMNMGAQCGFAAPDGTVSVAYENYLIDLTDDELLPDGVFDAFLQQRIAQIEAAGLGPYAEQAAIANATAFFTGLELSLDLMIRAYPDNLQVAMIEGAAQPSPLTYAFAGQMHDDESGLEAVANGAMNFATGQFGLYPVYTYGYGYDSAAVLHGMSYAMQMGGTALNGFGALRWSVEALNYDQWTGEVWGCGINNLAGFWMAPEGTEAAARTVSPDAYRLDAKAAKTMTAKVHQGAVRELTAGGTKVNGRVAAQVAALGKALAR